HINIGGRRVLTEPAKPHRADEQRGNTSLTRLRHWCVLPSRRLQCRTVGTGQKMAAKRGRRRRTVDLRRGRPNLAGDSSRRPNKAPPLHRRANLDIVARSTLKVLAMVLWLSPAANRSKASWR